jgi:hypothetical protein
MSVKALLSLILGLLLLNACSPREDTIDNPAYQDLLSASGGIHFERTLPADLKPTDWVYLALEYPDGTIRQLLGASGAAALQADSVNAYYFSSVSPNTPTVALQTAGGGGRRVFPEPGMLAGGVKQVNGGTIKGTVPTLSKESIQAFTNGQTNGDFSDPLMRFSTTGSVTQIGKRGDPIPEGSFDLILYVDPNPPTSAQ